MNILKILWHKWLTGGRVIGNFQAQVIFSLFYLLFLWGFGIPFYFLDPMRMKKKQILRKKTNFEPWDHEQDTLETARRQY